MRPISIYIHIPFCKRNCPYCTFYREAHSLELEGEFITSCLCEIADAFEFVEKSNTRRGAGSGEFRLKTIYFGGGTPSVMKQDAIAMIFSALEERAGEVEEVTFELNPEDTTGELLSFLKKAGVNRVSLGVQSLVPSALERLGRCSKEKNEQALDKVAGCFYNFNVDMLLGIPGSSLEESEISLNEILEYRPKHISLYCLEASSSAPAGVKSFFAEVDHERAAEEYLCFCDRLIRAGYTHYEVSNFALPGFEAGHNRTYWEGGEYIGIGPAAHSFLDEKRFFNQASIKEYFRREKGDFLSAKIIDNPNGENLILERLMLDLRTARGTSVTPFARSQDVINKLAGKGLARVEGDRLILTDKGCLVLDEIVVRLAAEIDQEGRDNIRKTPRLDNTAFCA